MSNNIYQRQAELMLRVLPLIMREEVFALKGGTAINFFWRDYPRLSVDTDLTYVPVRERGLSLADISDRLVSIENRIKKVLPGIDIFQKKKDGMLTGLIFHDNDATVKVDANIVLRGTVYPVVNKRLSTIAEKFFGISMSVNTLSFEDLYGGKICAALDRQHPRDLFDVKLLLENEGLTQKLRKAFIVYLISHHRPIIELLDPGLQDIKRIYENEFAGMTVNEISLEDLLNTRSELIEILNASLTNEERNFLVSFKDRNPNWELLGLDNIENLPAVKWKLHNLRQMAESEHQKALNKLKDFLHGNLRQADRIPIV